MRKIDGRKAEITNAGQRYDMYTEFAVKHGYPDAVRNKWNRDSRAEPKDGDIVTLLESGEHEYGWDTLWIVETADGERHIIGEKGLRILSEELSGVTVLKDDSLGGIEREYREVKRKAREGERIKIIAISSGSSKVGNVSIGEVFTVDKVDGVGDIWSVKERSFSGIISPSWHGLREYVVLEPSEIVRIDDPDGVNRGYRMVDRKAAVGERVIVVNAEVSNGTYRAGDVLTVVGVRNSGGISIDREGRDMVSALWRREYHVLEPVESAKTAAPNAPLSAQPPLDQAAANIAALQTQVSGLEAKVAELQAQVRTVIESANPAELSMSVSKVAAAVKVAEGLADDMPPSFAIPRKSGKSFPVPAVKSPQQLRDEIVERAKADVKALLSQNYPDIIEWGVWFAEEMSVSVTDECEFVVDRDKRTVVALIRELASGKKTVILRGIAKAAPNDVFNAHIGRAIALRRALGLEVPAEYLNVPNPEEPRVGDVVQTFIHSGTPHLTFKVVGIRGKKLFDKQYEYESNSLYTPWEPEVGDRIIDDSREEVGA